jgi:hypothetical protein
MKKIKTITYPEIRQVYFGFSIKFEFMYALHSEYMTFRYSINIGVL